jgi:hypothetical protein
MIDLASLAVTLLLAGVAAVVWLVRLEGKHNVLRALYAALKERVDGLEERILRALDRIESKLDSKADRE